MTGDVRSKLLPRNVAALRRFQDPAAAPREVTGNPVMTRLNRKSATASPASNATCAISSAGSSHSWRSRLTSRSRRALCRSAQSIFPGSRTLRARAICRLRMLPAIGPSHRICAMGRTGWSATSPAISGRSSSSRSTLTP